MKKMLDYEELINKHSKHIYNDLFLSIAVNSAAEKPIIKKTNNIIFSKELMSMCAIICYNKFKDKFDVTDVTCMNQHYAKKKLLNYEHFQSELLNDNMFANIEPYNINQNDNLYWYSYPPSSYYLLPQPVEYNMNPYCYGNRYLLDSTAYNNIQPYINLV